MPVHDDEMVDTHGCMKVDPRSHAWRCCTLAPSVCNRLHYHDMDPQIFFKVTVIFNLRPVGRLIAVEGDASKFCGPLFGPNQTWATFWGYRLYTDTPLISRNYAVSLISSHIWAIPLTVPDASQTTKHPILQVPLLASSDLGHAGQERLPAAPSPFLALWSGVDFRAIC